MPGSIRVVRWEEFQHYKDRDPVWIKLHRGLLDNYEWSRLQDASKSHLIGIWMLAARHDNRIPADSEWIAKRISASGPVDLQPLIAGGFIEMEGAVEQLDSSSLATRYARGEERRGEKEENYNNSGRAVLLSRFSEGLHRDAVDRALRSARNPEVLASDLRARLDGMPGHQAATPEELGRALHEMQASADPPALTPKVLDVWVGRGKRPAAPEAGESDIDRALRIAQERKAG